MSDKLWKQTERWWAKRLKGMRVPVNSTDGLKCDVIAPWPNPVWSIELKEDEDFPKWLLGAVSQAKANCIEGTTPLLILHLKGADHVKDLVIYEAKDWLEWYG